MNENIFLKSLEWRYAVKRFDTEKKLQEEDVVKIKEAIRMAPTSYGLQPFRVIEVRDDELKSKLKAVSFNQEQVSSCSSLFVFVANTDVQKRIGEYCDLAEFKSQGMFKRAGVEAFMRGAFVGRSDEAKLRWATNQVYIALGFALAACAELRIDSCPMEGFSSDSYKELLGLGDSEYAAVVLATGYRVEGPSHDKTRFAEEKMFEMR